MTTAENVYFCDMRTTYRRGLLVKIRELFDAMDPAAGIRPRELAAVKIHFGERGNTAFIRPQLVRPVVGRIAELGGLPFLTDANTLYVGGRSNAVDHLRTAVENGFAYSVTGVPVIIADGLKGDSLVEVPVGFGGVETAAIGRAVADADVLVSLAHFKLHLVSGFGATIKNLGMGCAARRGKMAQHAGISPKVARRRCVGCGLCAGRCPGRAIRLEGKKGTLKAVIDPEACIGCAECIRVCPEGAMQVRWESTGPEFMRKMVAYTAAVLKGKEDKSFFFNFITNVSPACDCEPHADAPIIRDVGILASRDPVAIDQAAMDLANKEHPLPGSCLAGREGPVGDLSRAVYPNVDWEYQLEYAAEAGLGSRAYNLVRLDGEESPCGEED